MKTKLPWQVLIFCLIFSGFAIVPVAAITFAIVSTTDSQRTWNVEKLQRSIQAEVPMHCDREQVEAWYKKNHIQYIYCSETAFELPQPETICERIGLRDEDLAGLVRGFVDDSRLVDTKICDRIAIYFFMDKNGRCVGHLVEPRTSDT